MDYVSTLGGILAVQGILAGILGQLRGVPVSRIELDLGRAAMIPIDELRGTATESDPTVPTTVVEPADLAATDAFEHHGCAVVGSPWRIS